MPEPLMPRVMVINFRPAAIPPHWHQAEALIPQYIERMKDASGGQLVYQVVDEFKVEAPLYPVLQGERQYDDVTWKQAKEDDKKAHRDKDHNYVMADYQRLIQAHRLVEAVQRRQVDEIWMFGGPYFGFYESCMVGQGAFWCNGPAFEHDCERFVIMGFNYERDVREMVHDYGHRAERILAKQFHSETFVDKLYALKPTPAPKNAFEQFLLDRGTVHRKPGGEEYQQDEFAWLAAMQPDWWPPTIDPNRVQTQTAWYEFLLKRLASFFTRR